MTQQRRRQVSVRSTDWEKASRLRDQVSRTSGWKVTITDTIARALGCLEAELEGECSAGEGEWWAREGKWSAGERFHTVEVMEREQLRIEAVGLLSQFIARTMPERRLRKVTLEPGVGPGGVETIVVHLDDREVPLFTGRVTLKRVVGPTVSNAEPVRPEDQ